MVKIPKNLDEFSELVSKTPELLSKWMGAQSIPAEPPTDDVFLAKLHELHRLLNEVDETQSQQTKQLDMLKGKIAEVYNDFLAIKAASEAETTVPSTEAEAPTESVTSVTPPETQSSHDKEPPKE